MSIDRKKVMKQTEEAAQRSGRFRYLKKGATTNLRVLEYKDKDGSMMFAQQQVEHRRGGQGGKGIGICRTETFGEPCAFCRANQIARDSGQDAPFTSRTRYVINAINIDDDPNTVRLWVIPTTVFNDLAEYVLDEEWADVLEPKKGYAFGIKREGSGLDTTYTVKPQRKVYPVGKAVLDQVVDPLDEIRDPGLEAPCAEIGVAVGDLFEPDELEQKERPSERAMRETDGGKKKPKKASKPEAPKFNKGDAVTFEDEKAVCYITEIDGDDCTIKDPEGKEWTVAMDDLVLVEDPEPEAIGLEIGAAVLYRDEKATCHISDIDTDAGTAEIEDKDGNLFDVEIDDLTSAKDDIPFDSSDAPKCFGDENLFDADDDECKKCGYFDECGGNAELNKAGVDKKQKSTGRPAQKPKDRSTDDIVSDIISGPRKTKK